MKRRIFSFGVLLALLGLFWGMSSPQAFAQDGARCASITTVQSGNTLSSIANETMGSFAAYREIVDATNAAAATDSSFATIENASLIRVGWKLCIPKADFASNQATAATADTSSADTTTTAGTGTAGAGTANMGTADTGSVDTGNSDSLASTEEASATETAGAVSTTDDSMLVAPSLPSTDQIEQPHPLMIEVMRQKSYRGSELVIEQTLDPAANYSRYVASYQSDGHKIFGLLTVPTGDAPTAGWPVILFNHGYIPPEIYRTAERYVAYQDAFARNGYISFKSDYRGHGSSEGAVDPEGPNSGNRHALYTADVLNALASLKRRPDVDADRIGMWGHSMGGQVTLRAMVISGEIKAGSLWAGTVADYPTMWDRWEERSRYSPDWGRRMRQWREDLVGTYGTAEENPDFWAAISPNSYLADLSGPILLQHATGDETVPVDYSDILNAQIEAVGGSVEYFRYEGDDHNLAANLRVALTRDVEFFNQHLK